MGSSSSKVAKTASSTARRYPAAASIPRSTNFPSTQPSPSERPPGPSVYSKSSASKPGDQHFDLDTQDADFQSRLTQIGPVQPVPTASHSSTFAPVAQVVRSASSEKSTSSPFSGQQLFPSTSSNPALLIVQARERFAKIFEEESNNLGRGNFKGRTIITAAELKNVLSMRDDGRRRPDEIEKQLRLREGLLGKLGPHRMVGNA